MPPSHLSRSSRPLSGRHLSFADREENAIWRAQGDGVREIARRLLRAPSTISRELRRNAATRCGGLEYRATTAQWHADRSARFVPLDAGRRRVLGYYTARDHSVMAVFVKFEREEDIASGVGQMTALLRQRHRLRDDQEDDFTIRNLTETTKAAGAASGTLALVVTGVAGVSLLVGGIGIMNIMLATVTERTREIGLCLAIGARSRDIRVQFLIEAATLSTLGGAVGIAIGVGATHAIARVAGWPSLDSPEAILLAVGFSALVGIFFGFYPAQRASRLNTKVH